MHSGSQHLFDIIILLSAAVFIVIAFWKMNISPVLGYFVAGALIGSHGFNLINSAEAMDNFAEFGVVFLLFIIGLELTFERLIAMRRHVFGFGSLQVIVTMIVIWCIALAFGVSINMAAVIGGGLALSSTAIVLQVLQEKGSQASQVGRLSIAVLLMQDFAVVPLIVLVPLLTGNSEHSLISSLAGSLVQAAIALVLIFVTGRLLLRPLFSVIAKMESNEIFISTTLLIILGSAFITEQFHLSMALGAFVAGLLVAETEHRNSVEHAVLPFKDLFLGLFFMTVGMSIDIDLLLNKLPLVTLLSIILIILKTSIIYTLCRFFGFRSAPAIQAGLLLAQGGEFAFILFRLADELDVLSSEIAQVLMMVTTVTMAFTPLLSGIGDWIANSFSTEKIILDDEAIETDTQDLHNHVIVAGFGRVGYMVTKMLTAEHLSYVVVDIQSKIVKEGKNDSFPIYLGDATRYEILKSVGIERAQALVVSIKNEVTIKKIVSLVATNFPHVNIIIRLPDLNNVEVYKDLGASKVIPETSEIGLQLGGAALSLSGISESGVTSLKGKFRKGNYSMLKALGSDKDE
ncbi:Glutathione-regulated potassium-efflux system protein [Wolbachia endosymbiont of Drosophila simulans wNo]|uniref:monovalent cation:proton antiporter-2 (CPA2) family protein n=1 Tax=unclassified Wolbachia TaxID=2640676 RepID=UPI0002D253F4|nr:MULTISPECIES: monovalent cation:proton antiporter-2 (CPA2) family protein [unclassified Wolbachia]AGJ98940.1 Glutathione-regulated potassium-efflux system protein [Wolbachia endosymbiont of Drosophila simulans wNo]QCB62195.1 potassium transporter [Wolbachia endosymbiont of Drosophila mauritiana]QCB63242.1 potassium transporter [Wolbachia endosymbiont of Drosophila mauritiana]QWE33499.1 Glutathione-regulated potassium-efflux system protein [Wolbachia endosymbiont of Drosophila simulans]TGB06